MITDRTIQEPRQVRVLVCDSCGKELDGEFIAYPIGWILVRLHDPDQMLADHFRNDYCSYECMVEHLTGIAQRNASDTNT